MNSKEHILAALEATTGQWHSSGTMRMGEGNPPMTIIGTDTYKWLAGKQFMIHTADVTVGDDKVDVIEIIGEYDQSKNACVMHAFQSDGSHGVMWASVNEDGTMLFAGDTTRATLTIHPDGQTMDALWEQLVSGQWEHWMDMHFAKD